MGNKCYYVLLDDLFGSRRANVEGFRKEDTKKDTWTTHLDPKTGVGRGGEDGGRDTTMNKETSIIDRI